MLIMYSVNGYGLECKLGNNYDDLLANWNDASDVVFGKILSGNTTLEDGHISKIDFDFSVMTALKGNMSGNIHLTYSPYLVFGKNISLGQSYVFFLYESNEVTVCSKVIPLYSFASSKKEFEFIPKRADLEYAADIQKLLLWSKDLNKALKADAKNAQRN